MFALDFQMFHLVSLHVRKANPGARVKLTPTPLIFKRMRCAKLLRWTTCVVADRPGVLGGSEIEDVSVDAPGRDGLQRG